MLVKEIKSKVFLSETANESSASQMTFKEHMKLKQESFKINKIKKYFTIHSTPFKELHV